MMSLSKAVIIHIKAVAIEWCFHVIFDEIKYTTNFSCPTFTLVSDKRASSFF